MLRTRSKKNRAGQFNAVLQELYFDLFRAVHGESASDQEVMLDAYRRFELLQQFR